MIYLDYNASTPVDPAVREAMLPYLGEFYGNPSSGHFPGRRMRTAVQESREKVAAMLGADVDEVIFTSGGTEANNFAIKSVALTRAGRGRHIIISAVEHPAVDNPCKFLEDNGYEVTRLEVDSTGRVDPQSLVGEIRPDTILISIMHANNEVGTIQPIAELAEIAREAGVLMHTDAAQSCGKIPTSVGDLGVDMLSLAGHKLCAPAGIGALYVRKGVNLEPLHHGAGHEGGRRAGTEPVAAIVGLGVAAELTRPHMNDAKYAALRDRLHAGLRGELGDALVLLGHPDERLPNTLAVGFRGLIGADVLAECPDICASTGAACHSGRQQKSATLAAMNVPDEVAFGAIRLSVGRFTTEEEIDSAVAQLARAVSQGKSGAEAAARR